MPRKKKQDYREIFLAGILLGLAVCTAASSFIGEAQMAVTLGLLTVTVGVLLFVSGRKAKF